MSDTVTDRYDTFGTWTRQLLLACRDDRVSDVRAIIGLRLPERVVLEHVTEFESASGGLHSNWSEREAELHPAVDLEILTARERPGPLPRADSAHGRRLLEELLRTDYEFSGPSPFWAESVECLRVLLAAGADPDAGGWMGLPLVVSAADRGNLPILRFLIEELGASPNAVRRDGGYTALHWATGADVIDYLLGRGADPGAHTGYGDSVLAQQVRRKDVEAVARLLSHNDERVSRNQAFHWIEPDPAMVETLLAGGIPPHQRIPAVFGEDFDTLLLHKLLRTGLKECAEAPDAAARESAGHRLVACVRLALVWGFDPHRRDDSRRLASHILADHDAGIAPDLCSRLRALLAGFDGERRKPPETPDCTCGSHLA